MMDLTEPLVPVPLAWTDAVGGEWRFERVGDCWKVTRFEDETFGLVAMVESDSDDPRTLAREAILVEAIRLDTLAGRGVD